MKTKKDNNSDEQSASDLLDFTEKMESPLQVLKFLRLFFVLNCIIWLIVMLIPNYIVQTAPILGKNKLSAIILGIPVGVAFYLAYTIIRYKIPDVEDNKALTQN